MKAKAQVDPIGDAATWRQCLRSHVVSRRIQLMCGSADGIATTAANDIPLVRGTVRLAWLHRAFATAVVARDAAPPVRGPAAKL
jgi:hypothetical protein